MLPPLPADYEIELKLRINPETQAQFEDPALLAAWKIGNPEIRHLESTYFETPDHQLVQRRAGLRVRRIGGQCLQTLKEAGNPATELGRCEWECPLPATGTDWPIRPDLGRFTDPRARELLADIAPQTLAPFFVTRIRRWVQMLELEHEGEPTRIEMAVDSGALDLPADGRSLPLCEIELELKHGHPGALYRVAQALHAHLPLELETMTKAARGYALAGGEPPQPCRAQKLELYPETTVRQAIGAIVRACLAHALRNQPCVQEGVDSEGVHQMRVGVRRLRSALTVFRTALPADEREALRSGLKRLADNLGPARDWDVFRDELLAPLEQAFAGEEAMRLPLSVLAGIVAHCREAAYARLRAALRTPEHTALLLRCGQWLEDWSHPPAASSSPASSGDTEAACPEEACDTLRTAITVSRVESASPAAILDQPIAHWAPELLRRRHKQARKIGADFASLSSEKRHQVRIALKKLRYTADFFRALYEDKPTRRYLQELASLQDSLGHLNDVATARRLLAEARHGLRTPPEARATETPQPPFHADPVALAQACGLVVGWHARGVVDQEATLCRNWERFAASKPFWPKPGRSRPE